MTRLLIIILCIVILWLAFAPPAQSVPISVMRATSAPEPTNAPATPGPSPTWEPPADAYPAPYPAPEQRHRAPKATPNGLHCLRCP